MNISVVIPLYNKVAYIRRAIESVLAQHSPADEIVVIDDGSTDGSADEVLKIADPRIHLIQQPNAGECAARNRGVVESRNDLVAFLDADDEWKPDFLVHIQRLVNNFPDCGAYTTSYEVLLPGGSRRTVGLSEIPPAPWIGILPNFFKILQVSLPFSSSSVAIPKRVFWDLGGFPVGVKRGGDLMMWIRLGLKYPIAFSPSCQAIYHTEADNRACVIFPSLGEPASAALIARMLENGEVPPALVNDLQDYYAIEQIAKAQDLIKAGHAKMARELLAKAKHNRKHRRKWFWWYFWAIMPHPLVNIITRMRSGAYVGRGNP
jgi:glycosyltransferase involved in cell wall biosynthesis